MRKLRTVACRKCGGSIVTRRKTTAQHVNGQCPDAPTWTLAPQEQAYRHFAFSTKGLTLYPLVCMHLGAPQCDYNFLKEHVRRIADDGSARWVYMGDGGECVTKFSKGSIYEQLLSPQGQIEAIVDLLWPIRKKGLFGIRGNHGHRIYKESGLSFDAALCSRLNIPFLGVAAMANLRSTKVSYDCYFHHGTDSGGSFRAKITAADNMSRFVGVDAIFTAHSHVAMELPPAPLLTANHENGSVSTKLRRQYICGTAYDSRTGYAEEKGYAPLVPAYISVAFDGKKYGQRYTRFASELDHALGNDQLLKFIGRREE